MHEDTDVLDYFPIQSGLPKMSVGLKKLPCHTNPDKNKIFQFDQFFLRYRDCKLTGRAERLGKYYQKMEFDQRPFCRWMIGRLVQENPRLFLYQDNSLHCQATGDVLFFDAAGEYHAAKSQAQVEYVDGFDALAMNVQEDLVIMSVAEDQSNRAELIHLFLPNDWSAEENIGKSFEEIHQMVPNVDLVLRKPSEMVARLAHQRISYERLGAMGLKTTVKLNDHPLDRASEPRFRSTDGRLFLRFERQTVSGFPEKSSFLFTIRTYICDLDLRHRAPEKWRSVQETFNSDLQLVNQHCARFIRDNRDELNKWLMKL